MWILVDYPSFVSVLDANGGSDDVYFTAGVAVCIVVAALAFLLTCLGCCGAAKENICMIGSVSRWGTGERRFSSLKICLLCSTRSS